MLSAGSTQCSHTTRHQTREQTPPTAHGLANLMRSAPPTQCSHIVTHALTKVALTVDGGASRCRRSCDRGHASGAPTRARMPHLLLAHVKQRTLARSTRIDDFTEKHFLLRTFHQADRVANANTNYPLTFTTLKDLEHKTVEKFLKFHQAVVRNIPTTKTLDARGSARKARGVPVYHPVAYRWSLLAFV